MDDTTAIVAQGQENAARSNLSFIERARFAKKLVELAYNKDTVKAALAIDDTLLSRMLSVAELVPDVVLEAVGAAKGVGRDRWEELKKIVQTPANAEKALSFIAGETFAEAQSDDRFNTLLGFLQGLQRRSNERKKRKALDLVAGRSDRQGHGKEQRKILHPCAHGQRRPPARRLDFEQPGVDLSRLQRGEANRRLDEQKKKAPETTSRKPFSVVWQL